MKKFVSIFLLLTLVMVLCVACTTSKEIKDGTFKAEFDTPDEHGWTDFVQITVTNNKITEVDFNSLNAEGAKKTEDPDYEAAMKKDAKTWPSEFYPKLAASLVDKQNISDVDAISGATTTSDSFKKLVKELNSNMSKGVFDTIKVKR